MSTAGWLLGLAASPLAIPALATGALASGTGMFDSWTNYQNQKDKLSWDKSVQRESWMREDNSVQRRVADLKAAGLSPVLAAGQGASSGPVVSTQAPQSNTASVAEKMLSAMTMAKSFEKTDAEIAGVQKQMEKANSDILLNGVKARVEDVTKRTKEHDLAIYKNTGTASNATGTVGQIRNLMNMYDETLSKLFGKNNTENKKSKVVNKGATKGW